MSPSLDVGGARRPVRGAHTESIETLVFRRVRETHHLLIQEEDGAFHAPTPVNMQT
jgi:hypothetical protein